jgi:hypothetical protein
VGAAVGLGLAAGAVGAGAVASPAGARARTQPGNGAALGTARTGKNAPRGDQRIYLDDAGGDGLQVSGGATITGGVGVSGGSSFSDVVSFARSGVVPIAAGQTTATQTGVTLTSASLVLATLQNSIPGMYVQAAVPSVSGSSFEIILSRRVPGGMTANVAWFIVN